MCLKGQRGSFSAWQTVRTRAGSQEGASWLRVGLSLTPCAPPAMQAGSPCIHPFPPVLLFSWAVSASPDDSTRNVPMVSAKGEPPPHAREIDFWKAHLWHFGIATAPF